MQLQSFVGVTGGVTAAFVPVTLSQQNGNAQSGHLPLERVWNPASHTAQRPPRLPEKRDWDPLPTGLCQFRHRQHGPRCKPTIARPQLVRYLEDEPVGS